MVEPLEELPEGCLTANDLLLLDFPSNLDLNPPPTAGTVASHFLPPPEGCRTSPSLISSTPWISLPSMAFQLSIWKPLSKSDFYLLYSVKIPFLFPFPEVLQGLAVEGGGGRKEEEEELECLSNKDTFPVLETSFEIPTHSRSSSGGRTGSSNSAAATAVEGARPSPVLVLAVAASSRVPVRPRSGRRRWEAEEAAASKSLTSSVEVERARSQWSSEAVEDWEERIGQPWRGKEAAAAAAAVATAEGRGGEGWRRSGRRWDGEAKVDGEQGRRRTRRGGAKGVRARRMWEKNNDPWRSLFFSYSIRHSKQYLRTGI